MPTRPRLKDFNPDLPNLSSIGDSHRRKRRSVAAKTAIELKKAALKPKPLVDGRIVKEQILYLVRTEYPINRPSLRWMLRRRLANLGHKSFSSSIFSYHLRTCVSKGLITLKEQVGRRGRKIEIFTPVRFTR
jgi:hypothetical protein